MASRKFIKENMAPLFFLSFFWMRSNSAFYSAGKTFVYFCHIEKCIEAGGNRIGKRELMDGQTWPSNFSIAQGRFGLSFGRNLICKKNNQQDNGS